MGRFWRTIVVGLNDRNRGIADGRLLTPIAILQIPDRSSSARAASILASIGVAPNCEAIRFASVRCDRERTLLLGFIEQAEDHFAAANVMAVGIELGVLTKPLTSPMMRFSAVKMTLIKTGSAAQEHSPTASPFQR